MRIVLLLIAAMLVTPASARTLELDDLASLVRVSSPRVAPDGKSVVVVISRPDYDENRFANQLIRIDVASGTRRVLTSNRPATRRPRWSPAGDALAFIANAEIDGKPRSQIFVLPMTGGEARQVTTAPQGVAVFEWAGSDAFVYIAADAPADEPEGPERHNKSFVVTHHDYLAKEPPPPLHVWKTPAGGGTAVRVNGDDVIAAGGILLSLAVTPDGSAAAFTGYPPNRSGDMLRSSLWVVDLATGARRDFGDGLDVVSWGGFSRDGERLAYSRPERGARWFQAHDIFVASATGGAGRNVTAEVDRTFYGATWMPDGSLLFGAPDGARSSLWHRPLTGKPRKLDLGSLNIAAGLAAADVHAGDRGGIAFVASDSRQPAEVFWLDSPRGTLRRLTDYNAAIAALDLGRVEEVTWSGPGEFADFTENGMLIYPPGFDAGKRYPLVLRIHGGPMGSSTHAFDVHGQLLAARGWLVFEPNYRGSANLGARYQAAVIGDAGVGPGQDVMAGLAAVKARGFVDASRIGVSGWSYGGYMTSWLIGNYPDVWRAAMAGAPVTDYFDQYTLSDINTGFGWGFETDPWSPEGQAVWREQSPIAYAYKATTPTLILCDTGDLRVPITESYKLYHALDDKGVPVEFVAYPVPGHFPGDPVHVRDIYRRWGDWMERWFN